MRVATIAFVVLAFSATPTPAQEVVLRDGERLKGTIQKYENGPGRGAGREGREAGNLSGACRVFSDHGPHADHDQHRPLDDRQGA